MDSALTNAQDLVVYLLPLIVAGGFLSPVAAMINKAIKAQKPITKFMVVVTGAAIATTIHAILSVQSEDSQVVAIQTGLITFFSTPFYLVLVKPAIKWLAEQYSKVEAYNAQLKSAVENRPDQPNN